MLKWLNAEKLSLRGNMKKIIAALIILAFTLTSCSLFRSEMVESTTIPETKETAPQADTEKQDDTTAETTKKEEIVLRCHIGFYDDLQNNGNYTRLSEWNEPWIAGKDIAVFDIIPSGEELLYSASYKRLWNEEADKNFPSQKISPYFILKYTLKDGTAKEISIKNYQDAQTVTDEGYLEVYLYDDIHQEDGVWYYHLTADTTNENTVVSSFKLTAGYGIYMVKSISLTVFAEGSSSATVNIACGIQS